MCHNSGAGKTDLTRNATFDTCTIAYPSTIVCKWVVRPHWMISKPHYMYADLRWIVKFQLLAGAHGIPNTYMKRGGAFGASSRRVHTSPVSSAHLNDLHRNITGLAVDMCVRSLTIVRAQKPAVEYSHTQLFPNHTRTLFL
jgi:hypothetical protein